MCAPDKRIIAQQAEMISKLEAENQRYKKTVHDNEVEKQQSAYKYLNPIIDDDNYLYGTTGMDREEFEWILERFKKVVEYLPESPPPPLFRICRRSWKHLYSHCIPNFVYHTVSQTQQS